MKYTFEYCEKIAIKYKHKIDFIKGNRNVYIYCYRHGYLYDVCKHMIKKNNNQKRLIYRFIFPDNYCYVGLTYDFEKRKNDHIKHDKNSPVYIHIEKTGYNPKYEILTELVDVNEAIRLENYWMRKSIKDGYLLLNRSKHNSIGGNYVKWTYDKCKKEALKYKSKSLLKKNNISVYNKIIKNKWMELCEHMKRPENYNKKWTYDKCKEIALKYKTKKDFSEQDNGAYQYSVKKHFIDDICKHMIKNKRKVKYTFQYCLSIASKYNSKNDFYQNEKSIYTTCSKNGWLNEIYKNLTLNIM